ncbi:hypothetical protein D3C87_1407910 [compost metagenome]
MQVQIDVGLGCRAPVQAQACGLGVLGAEFLARVAVVLPGAARFRGYGQAGAEGLGQRAGQIAFELGGVIAAVAGGEAGFQLLGRRTGDDADGAAGGVAAVEGALRAAQNLDAGDVEQQALGHDAVGIGDLVHVDADGRGVVRCVVGQPDAADAELRLAAAQLAVDFQAGDGVLQVVDRLDVALVQIFARDDGQGQADLLG